MTAPQAWRGQAIGLPQSGPGSIANGGPRVAAYIVDALASALIAALFVPRHGHGGAGFASSLPGLWSLVPFAADYILGSLVAGRTLGMYLTGIRLVRVDRTAAVDPVRILLRTVLLVLLVPALVFDRDGRGLHDRVADTAVVKS
jgi:uncharacterized RDD family membrane protein YckC